MLLAEKLDWKGLNVICSSDPDNKELKTYASRTYIATDALTSANATTIFFHILSFHFIVH
jgi:hypothetical protein